MTIVFAILLGLLTAALWCIPTILSYTLTKGKDVTIIMGAMLGTWVVKLFIVSVILFILRDYDFYDHTILMVCVFVFALISFGFETWYGYKRLKAVD